MKIVDAADFGAKGDGITDDYAAITAALKAAGIVTLALGTFRISAPLRLSDGQSLRGAGRSGWEPYSGRGSPPAVVRTELVVEGGIAIDARDTNNAEVTGLAIRSRNAKQSAWAATPGFQAGTTGIDVAASLQFVARDVSFHGLEIGLSAVADSGRTAQMPVLIDWNAHDCGAAVRLYSTRSDFAAARDARVAGCVAAVHCRTVIEAQYCDGLRIEDCRFFQCSGSSVSVTETPFVTIVGTTMFETAEATLVMRRCSGATLAGVQLVRAGFYHAPPRVQRAAVILDGCDDISFEGLIERPMGRAFTINKSRNVSISGTIATPFWSTGSLGSNDGAIVIERSSSIMLNAAFSGKDYWLAVLADAASAPTINGRISTEQSAGVARCIGLQAAPLGHASRLTKSIAILPAQALEVDFLRILVPSRTALVSRSVAVNCGTVMVQIGDLRWLRETSEPGGGSISLERQFLHSNETPREVYTALPIKLHNPTARAVTVPAGSEISVSLAIEPTKKI